MPYKRPTKRIRKAIDFIAEGDAVSPAMIKAGYSKATARNPKNLTTTKHFAELLNKRLNSELLVERHLGLLNSNKLEHMVFPPFTKKSEQEDVDEDDESEENVGRNHGEQLTDADIRELLAGVNCVVRKIVHGDMSRHVYFWSPDNKARKDGLDMAYEVLGKYPVKAPGAVAAVQVNINDVREEFSR